MKIIIMIIILLILAIAAIAGQGWFGIGKDPLAAENLPQTSAEITSNRIVIMKFSTEINGYSKAEVDTFLELLKQRLLIEEENREKISISRISTESALANSYQNLSLEQE